MSIYLGIVEFWYRLSKYPAMASLSHRQGCSFALFLLILPCLVSSSNAADTPSVTYRTGSSEVRVIFFATDTNNRPIENISANDFAVVDGEMIVRDFRSLNRSDDTALDVVLLVDASQSVEPHFKQTIGDVLGLISADPRTNVDSVSIVTFSGLKPAILCESNCSTADSKRKLASLTAAGSTPLYDSLKFTAQFVSKRYTPGVRQIVLVFSDGNDTISGASPKAAVEAMASTSAILYSIDVNASIHDPKGKFWLQQIAESTGGRSFSLNDGTTNVISNILQDLRSSYVVTYSLPSRALGFHSLRILPKHNLNLQFHCRRGYFYDEIR